MAASVPASLLLDRFVSASSAGDAVKSLERILEALQNSSSTKTGDDEVPTAMKPELIWSDDEIMTALRHVLQTGQHKHHDMLIPVEEGSSLVCRIYLQILELAPNSPLLEKDTALLETLIDVISNDGIANQGEEKPGTVSMYTRVLALQLLTKLCVKHSSKAQAQLLQAPNGLHRLGDLLQLHQEEIIRNEALLLAQVIAEWPSCAKIWMFSEVGDQVILLALKEGGLTGGNLLVQDCLDLLFNLWKHDPQNLADLVFQSPVLASNLPRLLDLRLGTEFINPPKKKPVASKDDDLDNILKNAEESKGDKPDEIVVPHLTQQEELVIQKTLDIMALLLESDTLKLSVWSRQKGLCSLMWELALVSPPPPQVPFVCAVPSPQLQQKALETTALYFHDPKTMARHSGLDRLLYLVCTGGLGGTLEEKMGISQAALHVIRKTVSEESANQMLMYTLAPPMTMDDNDDQQQPTTPSPTVVHKLLNTVAENLTSTDGIDLERRKIFLAGALGGLSIFLTDQTSREVMLRLTTTTTSASSPLGGGGEETAEATTSTSLVESILLAVGDIEENGEMDPFISMTLLRYLCHWTMKTPSVAHALLSSNQSSIVLSMVIASKKNRRGVTVLGRLLLGVAMEFMGDDESKCGGWTRASMMDLIAKKSGGVSKFTLSLEQFKSVRDFNNNMPWSLCDLEFKVWAEWYSDSVLLVRKRVVQELTGSGAGDSEEEVEGNEEGTHDSTTAGRSGVSAKSLQKVVLQQSQEIDELQQSLVKANSRLESLEAELTSYKRRVESAPSQLDNMLNEYSSKTSELELKVAAMEEGKLALEEKHKQDLKSRDDEIKALRKELEEARALEHEARDENDSLRGEISSLSQAYTSLEEEYRHQQRRTTTDALPPNSPSGQQPGEQEELRAEHQAQVYPITSPGPSSTESSTLRAENARLRNDAQAADQWMSMAVEKMKELGEQNMMLQTQLNQLREGQNGDDHDELQQRYDSLMTENQSRLQQLHELRAQCDHADQRNQQVQQQLNETRDQCQELDRQLDSARAELQACQAAMEDAQTQAKHDREGSEMSLEAAKSEVARLTEKVDKLSQQSASTASEPEEFQAQLSTIAEQQALLQSKDEELDQLRRTLDQQPTSPERPMTLDQMEAMKAKTESLKAEVERAREELETIRRREQEEIYKRESRIRELEARVSSGTGGGAYTADDIKVRDDEIAELQAANEAAQDWMQKAVEHHHMLSQQHAKACSENASLSAQLKELRTKAAQNEAAVARTYVLEQESSIQAGELRNVRAALASSDEDLTRMRSETLALRQQTQHSQAALQDLQIELSAETEAKIAAQEVLAKSRSLIDKLTIGIESLQDEVQVLRAKIETDAVKDEGAVAETEKRVASLESTVREMEQQLSEQENEANLAISKWQDRCIALEENNAELLEALKRVDDQLGSAQPENQIDPTFGEDSLAALRKRLEELETSLKEAIEKIAEDESVVVEWEKRVAELESTIKDLECQLSEQEHEASLVIAKWQQSCTALEERNSELVQSLEAQTEDAVAFANQDGGESSELLMNPKIQELEAELVAAREKIRDDDDVMVKWEEQVAELESTVKNLELQLAEQEENANRVIAKWQESCSALEEKNTELLHSLENQEDYESFELLKRELHETETALAEARSKLAEQEALSKQRHEQIAELKAELEDLQTQLADQETEANNAIAEWQASLVALEATNSELAHSLEDARNDKKGSDTMIASIQSQLHDSESALVEARAKLQQDEHALRERQDRIAPLETAIAKLQESNSALEATKSDIETHGQELERRVRASDAKLAETRGKLLSADQDIRDGKSKIAQLETAVSGLEMKLSEQEKEAKGVVAEWQEKLASVEATNAELAKSLEAAENDRRANEIYMTSLQNQIKTSEEALARAQQKLEDDETVVAAWQSRASELESTVKELENQLHEQEIDAGNVIAKWQEQCSSLEGNNAELVKSLDAAAKLNESDRATLEKIMLIQSQLEESEEALVLANQKIATDETTVTEWQRRVGELESALKELEQQLQEQEEAAANVIAQWEISYGALEEKNADLAQSLEAATTSSESARATKEDLEARLTEAVNTFLEVRQKLAENEELLEGEQKRVVELESTVLELEQQLNDQEQEASAVIAQWEESCAALEKANADLLESLDVSAKSQEEDHSASKERFGFLQAKLQESKVALDEANKKIAADEEALDKWQKRVVELESTVQDLEQQLKEQEDKSIKVIAQLQESRSTVEKQIADLQEKLNSTMRSQEDEHMTSCAKVAHLEMQIHVSKVALDEANEKVAADEETLLEWQSRCHELESTVEDLEQQTKEQEDKARHAIAQWQESNSALENQIEDLQEKLNSTTNAGERIAHLESQLCESKIALDEANEKAAADEGSLLEWKTQCHELEATVKDLEGQLNVQEDKANDAIAQWQESHGALENEIGDLIEKLDAANKENARKEELLSKSETWLAKLEQQRDDHEAEANQAIAQWDETSSILEGKKTELAHLHEVLLTEKQMLLMQITELEGQLANVRKSPSDHSDLGQDGETRSPELETIVNALQQQLLEQKKEASNSAGKLRAYISAIEAKNAELRLALNNALAKTDELAKSPETNKVKTESSAGDGWEDELLDDKLLQDVELDEGALRDLGGKAKQWESAAKHLEEDLDNKTKEMASAVTEWEDHCNSLEAQCAELTQMLEEAQAKRREILESKDNDYDGAVVQELEDRIYLLEAQNKDLEREVEETHNEAAESIAAWQTAYDALQCQCNELSHELEQSRMSTDDAVGTEIEETVQASIGELESTVKELQTRCAEKDKAHAAVVAQLEAALKQRDHSAASISADADVVAETKGIPPTEVDLGVEALQRALEMTTKERNSLSDALSNAQQKIVGIQKEYEDVRVESDQIVAQWTDRVMELESIVHDVEHQLVTQTRGADEAIASWEARCTELDQNLDIFQQELEARKAAVSDLLRKEISFKTQLLTLFDDFVDDFVDDFAHPDDEGADNIESLHSKNNDRNSMLDKLLKTRDDDIKGLEKELQAAKATIDTVSVLRGDPAAEEAVLNRIAELESQISEDQATNAQLQAASKREREETNRLRSENSRLEAQSLDARRQKDMAQAAEEELAAMRTRLSELELLEAEFETRLEKLRIQHNEIEAAFTAEKLLETEQFQELEAECYKLRTEKLLLEHEIDRFSKLSCELEEELREANDAMHVYRTQVASNRAKDMASQTMRQQLDEIRKQADEDRSALKKEREERIAAEREVARLRADLVALLDMNEHDDPDTLTMKAAGKVHAKERSEIKELRSSLSRALDELMTSRKSEKLTEESAAAASLQLKRCEQELLSAKSDLHYLIQTMDEMREAEDSRRAALEHRINALENEHEVLRRFHSSESEGLKNELTQAMMERDQLLQALKESEKSSSALNNAAKRARDGITENSLVDEVLRLRVEKAQLLVAAAEEGARTERRLREVVTTQTSGTEADLLVERERRLAAEAAAENLKLLVAELEIDVRSKKRTAEQINPSTVDELQNTLVQMQSENKKLMDENASLRSKLDNADKAKERAHYDIGKLKEECRMAQAKAHRFDRDARFHNDVKVEMSRLRTPEKQSILVQVNPAEDKKSEDIFPAAEVYDVVQKQADAIQRERELYRELYEEHEHLLSLLTLHDIERNGLHEALAGAAGPRAVDAVVREAEQAAVQLHGIVIPLPATKYCQQ